MNLIEIRFSYYPDRYYTVIPFDSPNNDRGRSNFDRESQRVLFEYYYISLKSSFFTTNKRFQLVFNIVYFPFKNGTKKKHFIY